MSEENYGSDCTHAITDYCCPTCGQKLPPRLLADLKAVLDYNREVWQILLLITRLNDSGVG